MKIFYMSTPKGDIVAIQKVYEAIKQLGHTHTSSFAITVKPATFYDTLSEKIWRKRYEERIEELVASDVCVFEISYPSFGVGQLVQEAIRREKPVLLLYCPGHSPHFFRGTAGVEKRVQLFEYDDDSLSETLEYGLALANDLLTTRFTMLMSAEMTRYLDAVNKTTGRTRSDYIRNLINKDMSK